MKYLLLSAMLFCFFVACEKETLSEPAAKDSPFVSPADTLSQAELINLLISKVSFNTMDRCIKYLTSIPSRHTRDSGNAKARNYLVRQFDSLGWKVTTHQFTAGSTPAFNIIAELKGAGAPAGKAVIVSAHYDSWGGGYAGANDNASGCAGLVAIAEALSAYTSSKPMFQHTIRLIAFSAEELGLLGSAAYVSTLDTGSVLAVINLDGIAPKTIELNSILISYKKTYSQWLVDSVYSISSRYREATGFNYIYVYNNHHWGTDTDPFWNRNFAGVWILANGEFPYANTPQDTYDKVDPVYGSRLVKAVASVALTLAGPQVKK